MLADHFWDFSKFFKNMAEIANFPLLNFLREENMAEISFLPHSLKYSSKWPKNGRILHNFLFYDRFEQKNEKFDFLAFRHILVRKHFFALFFQNR